MDTKAKRAAAIGYGLSFLLVLPPAGGITIEDAGHALSAYQFDMPAPAIVAGPVEIEISGSYQASIDITGVVF
jgi:hypothetical protein